MSPCDEERIINEAMAAIARFGDMPELIRSAAPVGIAIAYDEACRNRHTANGTADSLVNKHLVDYHGTAFEVTVGVDNQHQRPPHVALRRIEATRIRHVDLLA